MKSSTPLSCESPSFMIIHEIQKNSFLVVRNGLPELDMSLW